MTGQFGMLWLRLCPHTILNKKGTEIWKNPEKLRFFRRSPKEFALTSYNLYGKINKIQAYIPKEAF